MTSAEPEGNREGKPPADESHKRPRKKWGRMILKSLGIFFLILFLLIVFLPTILSILPLEEMISRRASTFVEGEVKVSSVSLGWISPLRIAKIELMTPDGESFVQIKDLSIEKGLLSNYLAEDRLGEVRIGWLEVVVRRDEEGIFNFSRFLPEAEEKPSRVEEPFELDIAGLFPEIELPTSALWFRIEEYLVRYIDEAADPPTSHAAENGTLLASWEKGSRLLSVETSAELTNDNEESLPFMASMKWERWVDEGRINFHNSDLFLRSFFEEEKSDPFLTSFISLENGTMESESFVDFAHLSHARRLFGQETIPELRGNAGFEIALDTTGDFADMTGLLTARNVEYETAAGSYQEVPDFHLDVKTSLHKTTLLPRRLTAEGETSFMTLSIRDTGEPSSLLETREALFSFWFDFREPSELLARVPALQGWIPLIDAQFRSEGSASYSLAGLRAAEITASFEGEEATFPERLEFPENVRPLHASLDLRPLGFDFSLNAERVRENLTAFSFSLTGNEIFPLKGSGALDFSPTVELHVNGSFFLERASDYLRDHFLFNPDVRLFGRLDYEESVYYDGTFLRDEGSIIFNDFSAYSEIFPRGRYEDEIAAQWITTTAMGEDDTATTATVSFSSRFAEGTANVATGLHAQAFSLDSIVHQGFLQADLLGEFLSPDLVTLGGAFALAASASSTDGQSYSFSVSFSEAEDFLLHLPEQNLSIAALSASLEGSAIIGDEASSFAIESGFVSLQDFLETTFSGKVEQREEALSFQLEHEGMVSHDALFPWMGNYLVDNFDMTVEAEGISEFSGTVGGGLLRGEEMQVSEPIVFTSIIHSGISRVSYQDMTQNISLDGLQDTWELSFSLTSLEPRTYVYQESHALTLDRLNYADFFEMIGLRAQLAFTTDETLTGTFVLSDAGVEAFVYQSEEVALATPPLNFAANASFVSSDVIAAETSISSAEFIDFSGRFSQNSMEQLLVVESSGEVLLGALQEMESHGLFGEALSFARGRMRLDTEGTFDYVSGEGLDIQPREGNLSFTASNVSFGIPDLVEMNDLGASFTVNVSGGDVRWSGEASPRLLEYWGAERTALQNLRALTAGHVSPDGRLSIYDAAIISEEIGTYLSLRGGVENIYEHFSRAVETENLRPVDFYFTVPSRLFLEFTQNLNLLDPLITLPASGGLEVLTRLENIPGFHTELELNSTFNSLTYRYLDMFGVTDFRGTLGYAKRLSHRPGQVLRMGPQRSDLLIEKAFLQHPPYRIGAENSRLAVTLRNDGLEVRALSEFLAGGTADSTWRLSLEGGDPTLEASFSVTGFDGATMFPLLDSRPVGRRTLDAFGTLQVRLRPGATIDGIVDDVVLRVEITRLGPDLLREWLRVLDREGTNPGIQSALTSMRFATPRGGQMDMRGGLLTMSVEMASAAGITFPVPILDRANVSNLLEAYVDQNYDPMLEMLRQGLLLLFAENLDAVREYLFREEE